METMIALFSVIMVGTLLFIGYRVSLYLYSQGAVEQEKSRPRMDMESVQTHPISEISIEGRSYGLRYARVGLLIVMAPVMLIIIGLVTFAAMMLR